ncbi:acidic mammalian chitinase-like [Pomacea canaliculata]|uniref:acidic mammalian chitinase-like n=1 Tax=Pomacea canaliculata TaxID=400727 RepID=UPI000D732936|nr:acidic mammalian chitinase-like [Pomacea canaliculata]
MCYYTNWAQYRTGEGQFYPEHISANLCTHVIYAFGNINPSQLSLEKSEENDLSMYTRVVALKSQNAGLRVLLAVGGAGRSIDAFRAACETPATRTTFASNVISFLRAQRLDGLDVDWEYPEGYKSKFTLLLAALRSAFDNETVATGRHKLLLTAAVAASRYNMQQSYEVDQIHLYLDYVGVMSYDYHGHSWSTALGHNSPLYAPQTDTTAFSQNTSVTDWIAAGIPADKLVMGLATYGRTYKMASRDLSRPGDSFSTGQGGDAGAFSGTPGFLAFYEICGLLAGGAFMRVWDNTSKVPYAYGTRNGHWEWITYDDVTSMTTKAEYIVNRGLGGAMFWNLDYDDFGHNKCKLGSYPLISTVSNKLANAARTTSTVPRSTPATTTTTKTTTTLLTSSTVTITTARIPPETTTTTATTTITAAPTSAVRVTSTTAATTLRGAEATASTMMPTTSPAVTSEKAQPTVPTRTAGSTSESATTTYNLGGADGHTTSTPATNTITDQSTSASTTSSERNNASVVFPGAWVLLPVMSVALLVWM